MHLPYTIKNLALGHWIASLTLATTLVLPAQTLARPGWAGSGLNVESWWQSAVFYELNPLTFEDAKDNGFSHLRGIAAHLDYLQSLGIDALVLSPFPLEAPASSRGHTQPFDPAYGSEDDLASLIEDASRRKIRILVDLAFNTTLSGDETANAARFWLSRGIAGLRLVDPDPHGNPLTPAQTASRLAILERLSASYPGQRVLFWSLPDSPAPAESLPIVHRSRHSASPYPPASINSPQLVLDPRLLQLNHWQASDLRAVLSSHPSIRFPLAASVTASDAGDRPRSLDRFSDGAHPIDLARQTAAVLLLGQAVPQLNFGQEIGMPTAAASPLPSTSGEPSPRQWDGGFSSAVPGVPTDPNAASAKLALEDSDPASLLNWYRRLSALRHANPALRSGTLDLLAFPDPNLLAWIRRGRFAAATIAPVIVLCNLSSHPVTVSLSAQIRALGLHPGSGRLRTLATSSNPGESSPAAPLSLDAIILPAYGVYLGELRLQPGLESLPASNAAPRTSRRASIRPSTSGR